MSTVIIPPRSPTDLLHCVGDVPEDRIVRDPVPGTAMISDVLQFSDGEPKRLCELAHGVLVEKVMGQWESRIGGWLYHLLVTYLETHNLGIATPADGGYRLSEDLVRFPDVAFVNWDRIPGDADPTDPLPKWAPNLAVEVLSPSNTRGEMQRKLEDYFAAGVELVWYIDPDRREVDVFTAVDRRQTLVEDDTLTGGAVLPEFEISVRNLFQAGELRRPEQ